MTWSQILFSFSGRLNRAKYWLAALIYVAVIFVALVVAWSIIGGAAISNPSGLEMTGTVVVLLVVFVVLYLIMLYSALAVAVKRLHDRDKSGWWVIIFYVVPGILNGAGQGGGGNVQTVLSLIGAAISIWALIELGFLRGTAGPNQYGPDPLAS